MQLTDLPNAPREVTISRQAELYAESDGDFDGKFVVMAPFSANVAHFFNIPALEEAQINAMGLARQMDQVYKENLGNLVNAKIKAAASDSLPDQEVFDAIQANYDFSGVRVASDDAGLSDEEKAVKQETKSVLRSLLRSGAFHPDGKQTLVQTAKEAATEELPAGKIALSTFNNMVDAAVAGENFSVPELTSHEFSTAEDPDYDGDGDPTNLSAFLETAREAAAEAMRRSKMISKGAKAFV